MQGLLWAMVAIDEWTEELVVIVGYSLFVPNLDKNHDQNKLPIPGSWYQSGRCITALQSDASQMLSSQGLVNAVGWGTLQQRISELIACEHGSIYSCDAWTCH